MPGPLQGIRAVEWAAYANAPLIGVILGDMGADVVKMEERGVGEPLRGMTTMYGTRLKLGSIIASFENANRSKRSLSIDLRKPQGREIAYKLIERADVFFTNYGQVRAAKVGLEYESLSKLNPRLVYVNATAYGPRGPDSNQRAWDPAAQARAAMMNSLGERNTPPSIVVGAPIDTLGATMASLGICAALFARQQTGQGQMINTSLLGSALWLQIFNIQTGLLRGDGSREHLGMARHLRTQPRNLLSNQYQCADGKWIMLATGQFDRFWPDLCRVMGIDDCRYTGVKSSELKGARLRELVAFLDSVFMTRPRDEWIKIYHEKNAEFAYSPVNEVDDLLDDAQIKANSYFVDYDHPTAGKVKYVNFPIEFSQTPAQVKSCAPEYAQHTEEVLLELGYSWEDIAALHDAEVI